MITLWVFGVILALFLFVYGMSMEDQYGIQRSNGFVAFVLPLCIIGGLTYMSNAKKNDKEN